MDKHARRKSEAWLVGVRRQMELYQGQRYKHQQIVDGEDARRGHLNAEIFERLQAIETMQAEIAELPVVVNHSRSVITKLNDQISTLKLRIDQTKTKQRMKEQLARVKQQIAELQREV